MTLLADIETGNPPTQTPSPGADCPRILTLPFEIDKFDLRIIVPLTLKSMVLVPFWLRHHRSEPSRVVELPELTSVRLVT